MHPPFLASVTRPPSDWIGGRASRVLAITLGVLATLGCGACAGGTQAAESRGAAGPVLPAGRQAARSHVVVIVMENKEDRQVLGTADAPYLNRLARRAGLAVNSFGVTHPSLPNYVALISGSTQGITDDCTDCTANGRNLADQLEHAHRTWGAYLEGLPAPCARPAS